MADKIIEKLGLIVHPSCCPDNVNFYFTETYRSSLPVKPLGDERDERSSITTIYLLAKRGGYGEWHRLKSDETFFYHRGSSLRVAVISPEGQLSVVSVGDKLTDEDAVYHCTIPAKSWFNSGLSERGSEDYGLFGVGVAPGFDIADSENIEIEKLIGKFPQHTKIITEFSNGRKV